MGSCVAAGKALVMLLRGRFSIVDNDVFYCRESHAWLGVLLGVHLDACL